MKKLILLLSLAFVICGCRPEIKEYGVITGIKRDYYQSSKEYKVIIKDLNHKTNLKVVLFTDSLYQIGDTIQIIRRTNRRLKKD
jgi:hypothetical protein